MANVSIVAPAGPTPPKSKSNVGAIVGGIIGGLAGLGLLVILGLYLRRRSRAEDDIAEKAEVDPAQTTFRPVPYEYTPYQPPSNGVQEVPATDVSSEPNQPSQPAPSKAREAAFPATPVRRTPPTSTSGFTTTSGAASSIEPPSTAPTSSRSGTSPISPQDVQGLRAEVENLRRVMQSFQNDRLDPPPLYEGSSS